MNGFEHLLVTTDFSEQALPGVRHAGELARRLGSRITLLYVVDDVLPPILDSLGGESRERLLGEHRRHAEDSLTAYAARHLGECEVDSVVAVGRPDDQILRTARRREVDLIVMATHGYGLLGAMLFGSTAERVLSRAPCPVLLVRSGER